MATIRLTQLDGKLPNLALMKLSHWHKSIGDYVVFKDSVVRDESEGSYDIVYGSTIFSSTAKKVELFKANFPQAVIGGTGYDMSSKVEHIIGCGDYDYEHYDYDIYPDFTHSIGFSQRGCRLRCKFCVVPQKEGKIQVVNTIADIWRGEDYEKKIHLLDNDFFGQPTWKERSQEIIDGKFKVCFNQGINVRLIHEEGAEYLSRMKYCDDSFKNKRIYTAWDNRKDEDIFMRGINIMINAGIRPGNIMVYFLCGYWPNETFNDIWYRFQRMVDIGVLPFPMIYRDEDKVIDEDDISTPSYKMLKRFQRWVVRRYYKIVTWPQYNMTSRREYYENKLK